MKKRSVRYSIYILSLLSLLGCIALLTSQGRHLAINLLERYIYHRPANNLENRLEDIFFIAKAGIFCILIFDIWILTPFFDKTKQALKDSASRIDFKSMGKPVLTMTAIYCAALITLFRANFYYLDDLGQTVDGNFYLWRESRYLSQLISLIVHTDFSVTDISPLPQLIAVLFAATASVLLVYVINNGKITTTGLLAVTPLALSPYFLSCLSYKYMSPYIAFSIPVSIVPFLFTESRRAFIAVSVFALWAMCTSYQASSGIYLMLTLITAFRGWACRQKSIGETSLFLAAAAVSYCSALLLFRVFIMNPMSGSVGAAMLAPSEMLFGIFGNILGYAAAINNEFAFLWKAGILLICILFVLSAVRLRPQGKPMLAVASIAALFAMFFLSFGFYPLLEKPPYVPRGMYGFGIFIAIVAVFIAHAKDKLGVAAVLALNWCFVVFSFTYGNALADQKRYTDFRTEILVNDLMRTLPYGGGGGGGV